MEVDGVAKADYAKVVDQCYLCDLCYMTKCPYVPPHPWNVDFPHLMLAREGGRVQEGRIDVPRPAADQHRPRRHGSRRFPSSCRWSTRRNATPSARKADGQGAGRRVRGGAADLRQRAVPRDGAGASVAWPVEDGARTPGKVAIFATCYVNYNEPGIGHDLLAILAHNEVPYAIVEKEACCGMPKLELGDLESVEKLKDVNIPAAGRAARERVTRS